MFIHTSIGFFILLVKLNFFNFNSTQEKFIIKNQIVVVHTDNTI